MRRMGAMRLMASWVCEACGMMVTATPRPGSRVHDRGLGYSMNHHPPPLSSRMALAAAIPLLAVLALPAAEPARDELTRQAQRCRQLLKTSLVDFYLPACVDRANGG